MCPAVARYKRDMTNLYGGDPEEEEEDGCPSRTGELPSEEGHHEQSRRDHLQLGCDLNWEW